MPALPGLIRRQRPALRRRVCAIAVLLIVANLAVWAWAMLVFWHQPVLLGTAFLAYGFGLRHAVDADHIAAIDNATRKLMQDGKRPVGVGWFFAMGHSTVVILAAAGVAGTATTLAGAFDRFEAVGNLVGTSVSALFLFAIAAANLVILRGVWRTFQRARSSGRLVEDDLDLLLDSRGLYARWLRPLFRLIRRSWHMYPLGFLFGLGFDTATEIALLAVAATASAKGASIGEIMTLPALFAAGMSLVDTTGGVVMLWAYEWAFINPIRKLYYNLTITFLSVVVAVLIAGIETLGLIGDRLALKGAFWDDVGALGNNFTALGVAVVGLVIAAWGGSVIVYRSTGVDEVG
jgi:high-affinity nickel-transport protein